MKSLAAIKECSDQIFRKYDTNQNGFIDKHEALYFFKDFFALINLKFDRKIAASMFRKFDKDGDNKLSKNEIFQIVSDNFF